jgi:hypothetical protein
LNDSIALLITSQQSFSLFNLQKGAIQNTIPLKTNFGKSIQLYCSGQVCYVLSPQALYSFNIVTQKVDTLYRNTAATFSSFAKDTVSGVIWLGSSNGLYQLSPQPAY